jgi:hypothetical protein
MCDTQPHTSQLALRSGRSRTRPSLNIARSSLAGIGFLARAPQIGHGLIRLTAVAPLAARLYSIAMEKLSRSFF